MRLGGPVFQKYKDPEAWVSAVRAKGYRAAFCPVKPGSDAHEIRDYREAARKADIVIAEVGAWSSPLSSDEKTRTEALEKCKRCLQLAEDIGARCCVNISGSRGPKWDGPDPRDLTQDTFDRIVETIRDILDTVRPKHTQYALETMPWMYPDSPDSYLNLIKAIDRESFGVHLDPVNLINSPERYFRNADLLRECFQKLGPHIKSCHAKDSLLSGKLTVHLDEGRPGTGGLDYGVYLGELSQLAPDTPLMLEHLPDETEYDLAANHIRSVAKQNDIQL
ncbi:MAG: sugar phosphate isomerase/epimerase [bacterium]|nr:sugar phosphate isomerase/epimerase [bacterium]